MKRILIISSLALATLSLNSCYTDPDPGTGVIVVTDGDDFRVPTAYVKLWQEGQLGTGTIIYQGYTDNNGELSYTHRDAQTGLGLEVILSVYAEKIINSQLRTGQGIIRIKPGEVSTEIIRIF